MTDSTDDFETIRIPAREEPAPPPPVDPSPGPTRAEAMALVARDIVQADMAISGVQLPKDVRKDGLILRGTLKVPSHDAFERWRTAFHQRGFTPFLRPGAGKVDGEIGDEVELEVKLGRVLTSRSNPWINLILFVVTLISTLFVGALYGDVAVDPTLDPGQQILQILTTPALLLSGWPFAGTLLLILTAHEFGHYFAARYHKVDVTLPYFLPMPLGFGTLGAFIRLKEPVPDKRKLFDIGVAGPLAGLILAVPLLFVGLSTSTVMVPPSMQGAMLEGNSILYYVAKISVFGQPLPDPASGLDVMMNRVTFAAWIGLLVTALNLLPLGQLDGGHTVFALFGRKARRINFATIGGMILLGIAGLPQVQAIFPELVNWGWTGWFMWLLLITFLGGPFHPPALDDVTPLDSRRRLVGYLVIAIFVLTFVPVPLRAV